jgi:Zn-dependent M28 family amino/carboxypeptidase
MVFVLNARSKEKFMEHARKLESFMTESRLSLNQPSIANSGSGVFFVAPHVAEDIFNAPLEKLTEAASSNNGSGRKRIAPGKVAFKTSAELMTVTSENVLGFLEGTDKKEELIIITAHYDHVGKKRHGQGDLINNGADDDGSGTVAVMQLAKAFAQAKKDGKGPRRSILFMTVAGEEMGLLGSEYYTEHPVFPLANTVADLNIDMIGRRDEQHKESPPYLYVIGADKLSTELHELSESVNAANGKLVFDYTYNDENHPARLYYRSDHWNFAQKNIPIIFYFDGIHEDYHQPSDEVDKIEFNLLALRTKCIFFTAWELANRPERIRPDKK